MMACRTKKMDNGGILYMCGDIFEDAAVCRVCGHIAEKLCDYPIGNDKTCDSALCPEHARVVTGDLHYCPEHNKEYGQIIYLTKAENNGSGI